MEQAQNYATMERLLNRPSLDSSYQAALYLLSSNPDVTAVACRYMDSDGINFPAIKRATKGFEERLRQVVEIAHNLFSWNSKCEVTPFDISRMGYPMMDYVNNAFYIAGDQIKLQVSYDKETSQYQLQMDNSPYKRNQSDYEFFQSLATEAAMSMEP